MAYGEQAMRFVERFALVLTEGGMPRMPARVFACVMVDDDGKLTAAELAERLQVSPAAISGAVRYLTQVGMLVKGRDPGERRDHYLLADEIWYQTMAARVELLKRWEHVMAEGADALGDRPAGRRLERSRAFFAFLREELPLLLERWEQREAADMRPD